MSIKLDPQLVVPYQDGGQARSISIPMSVLRSVALGHTCPTSLDPVHQTALLAQAFLVRDGGLVRPAPRLYWQTGIAANG